MGIGDWLGDASDVVTILGVGALASAYWTRRGERALRRFRATVEALHAQHETVAAAAFDETPYEWVVPGFPMLSDPEWVFSEPIDLERVRLTRTTGHLPQVAKVGARRLGLFRGMPGRKDRRTYSHFLGQCGLQPDMYDGRIFRLLDAKPRGDGFDLLFRADCYFGYLDTSEVLAYECQRRLTRGRGRVLGGRYRRALGSPWDFGNRVAGLGIVTLTVRRGGTGPTFVLHHRNGSQVSTNRGRLGIAPGGEFAPSDVTPDALEEDLDIWRNIMREYAEEFLNAPDAQRATGRPLDYENDEPYRSLTQAKCSDQLTIGALGLALDPLTWKPNLLTVCVIDDEVFDRVFHDLVSRNEEGSLTPGRRFDERTIARYVADPRTTPVAKACLQLAWRHREALRIDPDAVQA